MLKRSLLETLLQQFAAFSARFGFSVTSVKKYTAEVTERMQRNIKGDESVLCLLLLDWCDARFLSKFAVVWCAGGRWNILYMQNSRQLAGSRRMVVLLWCNLSNLFHS